MPSFWNRPVASPLQRQAEKVAAEGWRWVVAEAELDREACAGMMRRVYNKPAPLSKAECAAAGKLEARHWRSLR